eukprot:COSAG06_NODE_961_length_11312_cov_10.559351_2_plen_105_part_00
MVLAVLVVLVVLVAVIVVIAVVAVLPLRNGSARAHRRRAPLNSARGQIDGSGSKLQEGGVVPGWFPRARVPWGVGSTVARACVAEVDAGIRRRESHCASARSTE